MRKKKQRSPMLGIIGALMALSAGMFLFGFACGEAYQKKQSKSHFSIVIPDDDGYWSPWSSQKDYCQYDCNTLAWEEI